MCTPGRRAAPPSPPPPMPPLCRGPARSVGIDGRLLPRLLADEAGGPRCPVRREAACARPLAWARMLAPSAMPTAAIPPWPSGTPKGTSTTSSSAAAAAAAAASGAVAIAASHARAAAQVMHKRLEDCQGVLGAVLAALATAAAVAAAAPLHPLRRMMRRQTSAGSLQPEEYASFTSGPPGTPVPGRLAALPRLDEEVPGVLGSSAAGGQERRERSAGLQRRPRGGADPRAGSGCEEP